MISNDVPKNVPEINQYTFLHSYYRKIFIFVLFEYRAIASFKCVVMTEESAFEPPFCKFTF